MVHPLGFHERFRVGGYIGAVVAENLDARNFCAKADKPRAGTRRFKFNQIDRVALEQAKYRLDMRNGEFAVGVTELLHTENAGEQ